MYHFDKPVKKIAAEIRKLASNMETDSACLAGIPRTTAYAIYLPDATSPSGTLHVSCGITSLGDQYMFVNAELFSDMGRNNTIDIQDQTTDGIAFAIGFTCGAAMFRQPMYQNH